MAKDNNEIKVTFKAFNQEFNKAMKDMNQESAKLRQEMKLQSEQMKNSASESDKLTAVMQGLEQRYDLAKEKTAATAAALEKVKSQWGENSTEAQKFERQLRSNQIAEQQIANDITRTTELLEKAKTAEAERAAATSDAAVKLGKLQASEEKLAQSSEKLTAEYELQKAQLGDNATESQKLSAQMDNLNQAHDIAGQKVANYEQQLEQAKQQYGASSTEVQAYENKLLEARTAEQQLANEIKTTNTALEQQNDKLAQTAQKLEEAGKKMTDIGKDMTMKVTAPIVAAGTAAVLIGANFEASMSQVAAVSGATGKDLQDLEDKAREMGATTNKSAKDSADALGYMALAGWDNKQMMEGLEPILKLSSAGNIDLARTSDLVTDSMSAMQMEVDELPGFLDKVAQASANSNTEVDQLMEAFLVAGGNMSSFNVPLEESTALLGILADKGFKGAEAGTAMNAIFTNLTSGLGNSAKAMDEIGVSAFDASGNFIGLENVLLQVKEKTEGMTDEQRAHYISMIAGKEHLKSFQGLMNGLGEDYDSLKGKIEDSNGALEKMYDIMTDNLKGRWDEFTSALEEAAISIFEALQPALEVLLGSLKLLVDVFNFLPGPIQAVLVVIAGLAAAVGPVLLLFGMLAGSANAVLAVMTKVPAILALASKAFTVIKLAIAGINLPLTLLIAAVAGVAYLIVKYWDEIKEVTVAVFTAIGEFLSEWGLSLLIILSGPIGWVIAYIVDNWELVKEQTMIIFNAIIDFLSEWGLTLLVILSGPIGWVVAFIVSKWDEIRAFTSTIFTAIGQFLEEIWNKIGAFLSGIVKAIVAAVIHWWDNLSDETRAKFTWIAEMITKIWSVISTFFSNIVSSIVSTVRKKFGDMASTINDKMHDAWQFIVDVWNKILDFFMGISLFREGRELIGSFIDGMFSMFGKIGEAVGKLLSAIPDTIKNVLGIGGSSGYTYAIGAGIGEDMANGIKSSEKKVKKASKDVAKASGKATVDENKKSAKDAEKQKKKDAAESKKQATAAAKAERDAVTKALNEVNSKISGKRASGTSSAADEAAIWKDSIGNFKQGSKERIKAENEYAKSRDKAEKERLALQKKQAAERKKLQASSAKSERDAVSASMTKVNAEIAKRRANGGLSAKEEAAIWKANISQFKAGSKERIKAENSYAAALKKSQNETASQQKKTEKEKVAAQKKAERDALAAKKKKENDAKKQAQASAKAERDAQVNAMQKVNAEIAEKRANGGLSAAEEAAIWKKSINQFKDGSKERIKAQNEYAKAQKKADTELKVSAKDRFDAIKQAADDKKSLDQLSLKQEAEYWKATIGKFKKGTKERIQAQKEYQRTLREINDKVVSINKNYADQMKKIDDDLANSVKEVNKVYDDEFKSRKELYTNFAGLFDEFEVKVERSGEDLLNNLQNQVEGFKDWEKELQKLTLKGAGDQLIEELRQMGPKALPELMALNQLTADQLNKYSDLFNQKSNNASNKATEELSGLKDANDKKIQAMNKSAKKELARLQSSWVSELKSVTSATEDELKDMKQIGENAAKGLMDGLKSMSGALVSQATAIAKNVNEALSNTLGIESVTKSISNLQNQSAISPKVNKLAVPESNASVFARLNAQKETQVVTQEAAKVNINVNGMVVREEADIKKVAKELNVLAQQSQRGRGR